MSRFSFFFVLLPYTAIAREESSSSVRLALTKLVLARGRIVVGFSAFVSVEGENKWQAPADILDCDGTGTRVCRRHATRDFCIVAVIVLSLLRFMR